jgi:hypothetical protein
MWGLGRALCKVNAGVKFASAAGRPRAISSCCLERTKAVTCSWSKQRLDNNKPFWGKVRTLPSHCLCSLVVSETTSH